MLQEQPLPLAVTSPEGIQQTQPPFPSIVCNLNQTVIQEDLLIEYTLYRNKLKRPSLLSKIAKKINRFCMASSTLCQQLWREIMPEALRGIRQQVEVISNKDQAFFQEYSKKKSRFFLIVYDSTCQQEEMQQAFEKSTFITMEGRGIRLEELPKQTNSQHWKIKNLADIKKYTIIFFKYDMFGQLLTFGQLSKQLIDDNQHDEHFLSSFKKQLDEVYERYDQIEKDFASSYLEKEDRNAF